MLNTVELIRKKRDGGELTPAELANFIKAFLRDEIADYQAAALLMAAYLRGMSDAETQALTEEMLHSGEVLDFSYLPQAKVDKHSTGGVGDKTSLVIAPIAAAAGLRVPMISGRALGHTGGTLDKLESIPGFNTALSLGEFRRVIETTGAAIIGQTAEIAPADRRIYALRDQTATVESIPFITASIMSKKLAEGLDGLVLDVKTGSGAFMSTPEQARTLARAMVETGKRMGKRVLALITDMSQPLGWAVGNSLEVIESIETLQGGGGKDFRELCIELAAAMLMLGGCGDDMETARAHVEKEIETGAALDKFRAMVVAQGGDGRIVEDLSLLPQAKHQDELRAVRAGYITSIDTRAVGMAAMELGAGRQRIESEIDYGVGLRIRAKIGDYIAEGEPLCTIYYNDEARLTQARRRLADAYQLHDSPANSSDPIILVKEMIS